MFDQIRWLFFDIGSTLVDESIAYQQRFRDIALKAGVSEKVVMEMALSYYRRNQKGDHEAAKALHVAIPEWHTELERPYPDAAACLSALHKRYCIGIIANQSLGIAKRLESYGLSSSIDLIISSAEEGFSKPDPRIFQLALNRSGCLPNQTVMIGDRIDNDILPAKELGMHTIWIKQGWAQYWHDLSPHSDAVIHRLSDLFNLL